MTLASLYRQQLAAFLPQFGATVNVFAPGTAGGTMVQCGTAVPGVLVPYTEAGQLAPAPTGLAGGRASYIWIDAGTAVIGEGCELRYSGGTYMAGGTADWRLARVITLSKVATPFTAAAAVAGTARVNLDFSQAQNSHYIPYV